MEEKPGEISTAAAAKNARRDVFLRLKRYWAYIVPIRNELMVQAKNEGKTREEAAIWAYSELDRRFPEGWKPPEDDQKKQPVGFVGYLGDVDDLINPDYTEPDAGNRLRDSYVWVGDEFRRITEDHQDYSTVPPSTVTVMKFENAHTPPPTPLAVQIAEYYGEYRAKRSELLNRLASFAAKAHDTKDQPQETTEAGYLDQLE